MKTFLTSNSAMCGSNINFPTLPPSNMHHKKPIHRGMHKPKKIPLVLHISTLTRYSFPKYRKRKRRTYSQSLRIMASYVLNGTPFPLYKIKKKRPIMRNAIPSVCPGHIANYGREWCAIVHCVLVGIRPIMLLPSFPFPLPLPIVLRTTLLYCGRSGSEGVIC